MAGTAESDVVSDSKEQNECQEPNLFSQPTAAPGSVGSASLTLYKRQNTFPKPFASSVIGSNDRFSLFSFRIVGRLFVRVHDKLLGRSFGADTDRVLKIRQGGQLDWPRKLTSWRGHLVQHHESGRNYSLSSSAMLPQR